MKKRERNIFYSRIFKSIYVVLFLFTSVVFTWCAIEVSKTIDWNNIPFFSGRSYDQTSQCGVDMGGKLSQLAESANWENLSGEIDLSNPENTTDTVNALTSYHVEDVYQMQMDGSLDLLEKYLEAAREEKTEEELLELRERFAAQMEEQGNPVLTKDKYNFSDEFIFLYVNREEFETKKTVEGGYLADYVKDLYLWGSGSDPYMQERKVSLVNLYETLVRVGKEMESYRVMLEEQMKLSNMVYWIQDLDQGRLYTNDHELGDCSPEEVQKYFQERDYKNTLSVTRKNGVINLQKNSGKMSDAQEELMYFVEEKLFSENEQIFLALNTGYPVKDEFFRADYFFENTKRILMIMGMCVGAGILLLVVMTLVSGAVCGDRKIHTTWIEDMPTEITGLICLGANIVIVVVNGAVLLGRGEPLKFGLIALGIQFLASGIGITMYLSIVRRIKAGKLWKFSLVYTIFKTNKKIHGTRKAARRQAVAFTILAVCNLFLAVKFERIGIIIAVILDGIFLLYLTRESAGRQVIFEGLAKIAGGEIDFKIDTSDLIGETKEMADAVNHVGDGLTKAVQETVKSERMKADLITNVSHDIKTPLTSIINYVDLIKRENIKDEKIRGYVRILDQKSQRLKQLTEDLVEASKISSGNIVLDMQPIQLGELVLQTNGEFEEKFSSRHLQLICSIPEEPSLIYADGRRMWRVLENLYNNVAKYAMAGTRVYVDIEHQESDVIFSIKNISATALNIKPEELTQRFIRGDTSRSTEGSGLGLSIASNLVKMQNGVFDIHVDGDLFKISLKFKKADRKEIQKKDPAEE